MKECLKTKYYIHTTPNNRQVVWIAIPATGNCFRRWSLGKFSPRAYVDEIILNRDEYDLITFVRDPVKRFVAVWDWLRKYRKLDFFDYTPENLDIHLRPQYLFEGVHEADYLGRFETLEKDWEILKERYLLGPLRKPNQIIGDIAWNQLLTKEDLKRIVDFYSRDFEVFGYEREAYLNATI